VLVYGQQVHWRAKAVFDSVMARCLDELGPDAAPLHPPTRDEAIRRDSYRWC
jgi:hypothetical protein